MEEQQAHSADGKECPGKVGVRAPLCFLDLGLLHFCISNVCSCMHKCAIETVDRRKGVLLRVYENPINSLRVPFKDVPHLQLSAL